MELSSFRRDRLRLGLTWEIVFTKLGFGKMGKVTKKGIIVCLCVFHSEITPSLKFRPNGFFCCHGCGKRGDVFDFLSAYFYRVYSDGEGDLRDLLLRLERDSLPDVPGQLFFKWLV